MIKVRIVVISGIWYWQCRVTREPSGVLEMAASWVGWVIQVYTYVNICRALHLDLCSWHMSHVVSRWKKKPISKTLTNSRSPFALFSDKWKQCLLERYKSFFLFLWLPPHLRQKKKHWNIFLPLWKIVRLWSGLCCPIELSAMMEIVFLCLQYRCH